MRRLNLWKVAALALLLVVAVSVAARVAIPLSQRASLSDEQRQFVLDRARAFLGDRVSNSSDALPVRGAWKTATPTGEHVVAPAIFQTRNSTLVVLVDVNSGEVIEVTETHNYGWMANVSPDQRHPRFRGIFHGK